MFIPIPALVLGALAIFAAAPFIWRVIGKWLGLDQI